MTAAIDPIAQPIDSDASAAPPSDSLWRNALRSGRVLVGGGVLLVIFLLCLLTLPSTLSPDSSMYYDRQDSTVVRFAPFTAAAPGAAIGNNQRRTDLRPIAWFGYDMLGRSIFARCLLGGTISLAVGIAAATISVLLGVTVGLFAGYRGGLVDSSLMRIVDVLYGLPYVLLVVLFKIGLEPKFQSGVWFGWLVLILVLLTVVFVSFHFIKRAVDGTARHLVQGLVLLTIVAVLFLTRRLIGAFANSPILPLNPSTANLVVLFLAIGLVSWLTMVRVVRGQVLSIRSQPYIEACRAIGLPQKRIFLLHILPNLIGPITVYATLTVPSAILQESFLSFLGVGINPPLPTWGSLASDGIAALSPVKIYWWMLVFPCVLLVVTLLSLNFMGDGLRDLFDPKREAAKI